MRIPIAKEGFGILTIVTIGSAIAGGAGSLLTPWAWAVVGVVWLWAIAFFRDPARNIPRCEHVLYSPADGRLTEIVELPDHPLVPGPCVRIRIFLSLFNAHINRMPCAATVESISHRPGRFLNAMKPESAEQNESNTLLLRPQPPIAGPIVVRQIAGLVARRILCHARVGQAFDSGQRFGMIKFGSGTELVVPRQAGLKVLVKVGVSVKAGLTELMRLDMIEGSN